MKGVFWLLIGMGIFVTAGFWYAHQHQGEPVYSGKVKPIQKYTVFGGGEAFAQPVATDTVWVGTPSEQPRFLTPEETVDMDMRYIRRLLVELLEYLPKNNPPSLEVENLVYRPPPTPAEKLRQRAAELEREAQRLDDAVLLRRQVEQAITWIDTTNTDSGAGK